MERFLKEFKQRMKISHSSEDPYLLDLLAVSYDDITALIEDFDMESYRQGKELVFERARYAYNDSLEYFYGNFQQRIMDISLDLNGRYGNGG